MELIVSRNQSASNDIEIPSSSPRTLFLLLLASFGGALGAVLLLPHVIPGLAVSVSGGSPKAFWFLSRGSAFAAYGLLWLSMAFGLIITNKMARLWPGGPAAYDVHEYTSILGMEFALFHALILLGDNYINYTFAQLLVPFNSLGYKPFWVGFGQLAFYVWGIVTLSFYLRQGLGGTTWRLIHYASYALYLMALAHGIFSGSDSSVAWVVWMYWISGAGLLFLLVYRIAYSVFPYRSSPGIYG
jgi:predicted ferric reductase